MIPCAPRKSVRSSPAPAPLDTRRGIECAPVNVAQIRGCRKLDTVRFYYSLFALYAGEMIAGSLRGAIFDSAYRFFGQAR
jgi:hypothetical protein